MYLIKLFITNNLIIYILMEEDEQKQLEQEKLKSMKYRMYENEYPNRNDFVIVSENSYLNN